MGIDKLEKALISLKKTKPLQILKFKLAKDTIYETPYYVIKGKAKGNKVMITAGIHGNERAGIFAATQLIDNLQNNTFDLNKGKLVIVPLVNQKAFYSRTRGKPDLNRTFPSMPDQPARHLLSGELFRIAMRHKPNWYIDLHEANGLSKVNPRHKGQTLITSSKSKTLPTIRQIVKEINRTILQHEKNFSVRLYSLYSSGRTAAERLLKANAITVETCWSLPLKERVKYQTEIIRYILIKTHLMERG
jgi:succinylglutamate desuccinylase